MMMMIPEVSSGQSVAPSNEDLRLKYPTDFRGKQRAYSVVNVFSGSVATHLR